MDTEKETEKERLRKIKLHQRVSCLVSQIDKDIDRLIKERLVH